MCGNPCACRDARHLEAKVDALEVRVKKLEALVGKLVDSPNLDVSTKAKTVVMRTMASKGAVGSVGHGNGAVAGREQDKVARSSPVQQETTGTVQTRPLKKSKRQDEASRSQVQKTPVESLIGKKQAAQDMNVDVEKPVSAMCIMKELDRMLMSTAKQMRIKQIVQNFVPLCANERDLKKIAHNVLHKIFQCCQPSYTEALAHMSWSPYNWFTSDTSPDVSFRYSSDTDVSLISMWCEHQALIGHYVQWILRTVIEIDSARSSEELRRWMAEFAFKIIENACIEDVGNTIFSLSELCCAATVVQCVYRSLGDIDAAAAFIVDMALLSPENSTSDEMGNALLDPQNSADTIKMAPNLKLVVIAAALEVWPNAIHNCIGDVFYRYITALCKSNSHIDGTSGGIITSPYDSCGHYAAKIILHCLEKWGKYSTDNGPDTPKNGRIAFLELRECLSSCS